MDAEPQEEPAIEPSPITEPRLSAACVRYLAAAGVLHSIPVGLAVLWVGMAMFAGRSLPSSQRIYQIMGWSFAISLVFVYLGNCYIFWRLFQRETMKMRERWIVGAVLGFLSLGLGSLLVCALYFG